MSDKATKAALTGLEVAVVGMAGRFPGAEDIESFWQNLRNGVESVRFFSDEELLAAGVEPELLHNPKYVKAKCVLDDVASFDAEFFDYFPKEAQLMDPQMRIFHEVAWEALEDAGYVPDSYSGSIGLYAGASTNMYWEMLGISSMLGNPADTFAAVNVIDKDFLATQVSYKLNLKGPSVFVKSACSTSLLSIHMACRALLMGECDMALAGGVTVELPHKTGYLYQEGMILSPDGHLRAFDAEANGIIGGEGAGLVVLKLLKHAQRDGDHIYAVIKGSAINNDGNRKVGYSAPSVEGQSDVIRAALRMSRVEAESISYVEAHGTGTKLGDPVEIEGLKRAFGTPQTAFCAVGSVKTNIGHLDSAAGIASFIKTALAIQHQELPPSLHYKTPNPEIDFANSPFYVNTALKKWENPAFPLRAGISAFGTGGTNVHVIVEEAPAPAQEPSTAGRPTQLLLLSAKTPQGVTRMAGNLARALREKKGVSLADVAYTTQIGRKAFGYRRALVASDLQEAVAQLTALETQAGSGDTEPLERTEKLGASRKLVFMFPGQGSQFVNMGLELYEQEPSFAEEVNHCFSLLNSITNWNAQDILYPSGDPETAKRLIYQTEYSQPILFVFEYALAKLLLKWGLKPHAMIGHSIGEYTAACLAGVFTLEEALRLVVLRGNLMQRVEAGSMLSVPLAEADLNPLLHGGLSLAAVNTPSSCVIAGPTAEVEALRDLLVEQRGIEARMLNTSHAFHSSMMDSILGEFAELTGRIQLQRPQLPVISNLTGGWLTDTEATDPAYWVKHLRQTVRFSEGAAKLLADGETVFVEVGPGTTLSTFVRKQAVGAKRIVLNLLKHPNETTFDLHLLLERIGQLWQAGVDIDWKQLHAGETRYRVSLPTYPFERKPYWIDGSPTDVLKHVQPKEKATVPVQAEAGGRKTSDEWFYAASWRQVPAERFSKTGEKGTYLLFMEEIPFHEKLAAALRLAGHEVLVVTTGTAFQGNGAGAYSIRPDHAQDYQALFQDLLRLDRMPDKLVHLWSLSDQPGVTDEPQRTEEVLAQRFYSLIELAKAHDEAATGSQVELIVLSDRLYDVTGEGDLKLEQALLLGPSGIIPIEYPKIKTCSIDVTLPAPQSWQEQKLVEQVTAEITRATRSEQTTVLRGNQRWVRDLLPIQLEKNAGPSPRLRSNGVYLITGGLGGVGLLLAEHIAKQVPAKLVLLGRASFPARAEWESWIAAHGDEQKTSQAIRKVQQLESLGAEVLVLSADVANQNEMSAVWQQIQSRFGGVHGVIHAAGTPDGGAIKTRTRELSETVFASKVRGTMVLDALLRDQPLDFLVLCSSLASVMPAIGDVAYRSANAFLDSYAAYKSRMDGTFAVSVNWDGIKEVGMTVNTAKQLAANLQIADYRILLKHDQDVLEAYEVPEVFERVLNSPVTNVLVSTTELSQRMTAKTAEPDAEPTVQAAPVETQGSQAYRQEVGQAIAAVFQEKLGMAEVRVTDNYFDLGIDSLALVQIYSVLNQLYPGVLNVHHLFESRTIQNLVQIIVSQTEIQTQDEPAVNIIEF